MPKNKPIGKLVDDCAVLLVGEKLKKLEAVKSETQNGEST